MAMPEYSTEYADMDDETLAAAAKSDPEAAAEIIRRVLPSIRAASLSISPPISDDLLQEGLLGALSAIKSFDPQKSSLRGYLLLCARSKMLSALKRNSPIDAQTSSEDIADDSSAEEYERRELFERLYVAMKKCLTPLERSVLTSCMAGRSYRETAAELSISEKSVDNAVQRARKKLRKELGG